MIYPNLRYGEGGKRSPRLANARAINTRSENRLLGGERGAPINRFPPSPL